MPVGNREFVAGLERRFDRRLTLRRPGRQPKTKSGIILNSRAAGVRGLSPNSPSPNSPQTREAMIGCHILNRMAELGQPKSYAVTS